MERENKVPANEEMCGEMRLEKEKWRKLEEDMQQWENEDIQEPDEPVDDGPGEEGQWADWDKAEAAEKDPEIPVDATLV